MDDIFSDVTFHTTSSSPALYFNYKYAIQDKWFFYADLSYQVIKQDVKQNSLTIGDVSNRFITVGFGTDYRYISKDIFQMYSGVSIAYTTRDADFTTSNNMNDKHDGFFNFQVNALGFRVGKKLAGIAELGFGYKGIANVGVSYQF